MFQRKRSVSFGGYGWWVPFLSLPTLLLGAWGCARSFFFSCCGFKGGRTVALRQGALAAEPFPLPRASRSVWESGQTFFPPPPRRALWEPCGCQALRGPPWGLVVGSRGHVACKRVLWFPPPPLSLPRTCCPLLLCPGCKAHGRLQHLTARSHLVRGTFPVPSASPGVVPALSVLGRAPRLPPAPRVRRDCSLLVC